MATASIGTLANEWLRYRTESKKRIQTKIGGSTRQVISRLRREFDDLFSTLLEIIDIFAQAENRSLKVLKDQKLGWGHSAFDFSAEEYDYLSEKLGDLQNEFSTITSGCSTLQKILCSFEVSGEQGITADLADFNERLNDVLFNSQNIGDALKKLDRLRERASRFLDELSRLGNS